MHFHPVIRDRGFFVRTREWARGCGLLHGVTGRDALTLTRTLTLCLVPAVVEREFAPVYRAKTFAQLLKEANQATIVRRCVLSRGAD